MLAINIALGALCVLLTWLIWAVHRHFISRPKEILKQLHAQGIKGYPFRPFVGQLPEIIQLRKERLQDPALAAATEGFRLYTNSAAKYGAIWSFSLGPSPRVVIADPALARLAFVQLNDAFPKSDFMKGMRLLGDGLLTSNGSVWSRQRRLINPAFSHKEIKRIFPTMVLCAKTALSRLEAQARAAPGQPVNLDSVWMKLTVDIICRSAFGSKLDSLEGGEQLFDMLLEAFPEYLAATLSSIQFTIVLPIFAYFPAPVNLRIWRSERNIRDVMRKIIVARLAKRQSGPAGEAGSATDLLELMINSTEGLNAEALLENDRASTQSQPDCVSPEGSTVNGSPSKSGHGEGLEDNAEEDGTEELEVGSALESEGDVREASKKLTVDMLMDNSITFLLAGHETTSNLLTWTSMLLSKHPEWQVKARQEVNALFEANGGGTPTFDQLSELKIIGWVLHESLRLYTPAPIVGRTCARTVKLSENLTIPKGCDIAVPVGVIHRSKDLWGEDAEEFRPERFANGISRAAKHPNAFMPFSVGPRTCIGQSFAMAEAKILLAMFLRTFAWKLSPEYRHHSEFVFTLRPKFGLPVELTLLERSTGD